MNSRRQALGPSVRAAAVALGIAASAGATEQAPVASGSSPQAESPDHKEAPAAPEKPEGQGEGWRRERFALKRGTTKLEIIGYLQEDFRHYDWQVSGDVLGTKQAKEHELRRIRVGARAQFGKLLLEGSAEPRHFPAGSRMKSLSVAYAFARPFSVRIGFFKLPGSKEFNAPTNATDFLDRTMIATRLVPERDWGLSASGLWGRVEYLVGAFRGDGSTSIRKAGTTFGARAAVDIVKGLQLGGSFMEGRVSAAPPRGSEVLVPKGAYGQTATGYVFSSRPYVDGARTRLSSSLSYSRGRFRFLGEYLQEQEERRGQGLAGQDLPDALGKGWSAQAAYLLTGERKGALVEPRPSVFNGGLGAIELLARVEAMNFDDTGDPAAPMGSSNRASNLRPTGVSAVEAGVNYWPSNFMKLQTTAIWETYNDPLIAPNPGNRGSYFSFISRIQFMIP